MATWPAVVDSLSAAREEVQVPAGLAMVAMELCSGMAIVIAGWRWISGVVVLGYVGLMCGGRMALDVPRRCDCLWKGLPAEAVAIVLAGMGMVGVLMVLFGDEVRGRRRVGVAVAPVAFMVALVLGRAAEGDVVWKLDGAVGRVPGVYSLMVTARGEQDKGARVVSATSSCECIAVVGVDGSIIAVRVVREIPEGVWPQLLATILLESNQRIVAPLEVPLCADAQVVK